MEQERGVTEQDSELRFRSRSEHTLDAKGRLNIPTRFREVLQKKYTDTLFVTNWKKCLRAYPVSVWRKMEDILLKDAPRHEGMSDFVRYVISGVAECTLDRQGRILVPNTLRTEFNITSEVVLNGMLDYFEIWEKGAWIEETRETRAKFKDFEQGLSSLGIM